jgi:hypothetical protein
MYGRRMSAVFSISATLRICRREEQTVSYLKSPSIYNKATHMDRGESSSVSGGHVLVHRCDGVGSGELTVLLVQVVGT